MQLHHSARNKTAWNHLSAAQQASLTSAAKKGTDALVRAVLQIKGVHVEEHPAIAYDALYASMQMIAGMHPERLPNKRSFHTFAEQFSAIEALVEHAQTLTQSQQRGR